MATVTLYWKVLSVILFAPAILIAGPSPATVTLLSSANPSPAGTPVTLTATLSPASASGSVTFSDGFMVLGTATLTSGSASLTSSLLLSGPHSITAYYSGDASNAAGKSTALALAVSPVLSIGFFTAVNYPAGFATDTIATPRPGFGLTIGDFNGDGHPDIAAGSAAGAVFINNGNGTLGTATLYTSPIGFSQATAFRTTAGTDLALAGDTPFMVSFMDVLPGNGNGTFQTATIYAIPNTYIPAGIAAGDFNGDGKTDLVTFSYGFFDGSLGGVRPGKPQQGEIAHICNFFSACPPDMVSVFIGNGDGTFQPAPNFYLAGNARLGTTAIAAGDLNGDGRTDLVIPNTNGAVGVFLSNGDGTFRTGASLQLDFSPNGVVVTDLNGDGKQDIVLSGGNAVAVLLGNGDGTFAAPIFDTQASGSGGIAAADMNGDGNTDIVLTSYGKSVLALLGNGDGTLQPAVNYALSYYPQAVAVADFNGDGIPDIATGEDSTSSDPGVVSILLGLSTTTGPTPTTTTLTASTFEISAGQGVVLTAQILPVSAGTVIFFDGTTAIGTASISGQVATLGVSTMAGGVHSLTAVYEGDFYDASSTSAPISVTVDPVSTRLVLFSSLNPSNFGQNVTLRATVPTTSPTGSVRFMDGTTLLGTQALSGGTATLTIGSLTAATHSLTAVYSGDASNMGSTSTALIQTVFQTRTPSSISFAISSGPLIYGQSVMLTATVSPAAATGIVTFYDGVNFLGTAPVSGGQAQLKITLTATGRQSIQARYDGDSNYAPSLSAALPRVVNAVSANTFAGALKFTAGNGPAVAATGDFNGDGLADLVVTGSDQTISIFPGNGDGTFGSATTYAVPFPGTVVTADFNGDGKTDLAIASSAEVAVLLGNGDGTFQRVQYYSTGVSPVAIMVSDLNGDGYADLVTANIDSSISVLLGRGDGSFAPFEIFNTPDPFDPGFYPSIQNSSPQLVAGDFNGDGIPDLAATLGLTGNPSTISIFLGNGDGSFLTRVEHTVLASTSGLSGYSTAKLGAADFNGDGATDLAISLGGAAAALLSNGDGTFRVVVTNGGTPILPGWSHYGSLTVGDFNGDGVADFAIVGYDPNGNGAVYVLPGNGNGTFQSPFSYPVGNATSVTSGSFFMLAGDFNGDGRTDLAISNSIQNNVAILPGTGPGQMQTITFGPLSDVAFGKPPFELTAAASSGLPVSYFSSTPLTCTVSAGTVAIVGTGGCSITAIQTGNSSFGAAPPITQRFAVHFSDIAPSDYYASAVDLLAQYGITAGCGSGDFCASSTATRAEAAIFLVRAVYGGDNFIARATPYFTDVQPGDFGFRWIQKLFELGITAGCGNGTFCPDNSLTRDEAAILIIRVRLGVALAGRVPSFTYSTTPFFTDVPASDFAFPWVQRMKQENITSGCAATAYCPNSPVTRGEMAIFMMRGAFNQLLPAGTPVLTAISPATLEPGSAATFKITGVSTNFLQGTTTLGPIPGVTAGPVTVTSPTTLTVQLTAAANAIEQPLSVMAITGTEQAVLPNGLLIQ